MTDQLKQIIIEEIGKLPKDTQSVINSFNWLEISKDIGFKNLFSEDEINKLQTEVLLVLVGMEYLDDLETNIEDNTSTTKQKSEQIVVDLKSKIFKPIAKKINEIAINKSKQENTSWNQRINFIVSGGDYSCFIEK